MTMPAVAEQTSASLECRLVLAQVDRYTLAIPALWVAEISRFQQAQVLNLPFYQPPLMGLMHQNGQVISLVSAAQLFKVKQPVGREISTVVRLGDGAGTLSQVGVVVDKILGSTTHSEVSADLFEPIALLPKSLAPDAMVLLRQEWFPKEVWQPQQWI
ncbi:MAG: chemotaxis protein CheW [Thermosynechococcaceae cyanobacterium]